MDEKTKTLCDTAQLLMDFLRACFGTIMVEPHKWTTVSTVPPSRGFFRYVIRSGNAAFTEASIDALSTLLNAALRTGKDSSAYNPDQVAKQIVVFFEEKGWGDYHELSSPTDNHQETEEKRKTLVAMTEAVAIQLYRKTDIGENDEAQIEKRLQDLAFRMQRDNKMTGAVTIGNYEVGALSASVDLLMRQIDFPEEDGFLSAADEQRMWVALCRLYSSGMEVDSIIRAAVDLGIASRYGAQAEAVLTYYMAKFDLKRGNVKQSDKDLKQLKWILGENKSKIDGACIARMSTLAGIRALTNNAVPSVNHIEQFERAIHSLQDLDYADDNYKRYETASAIGAEITNSLAKGAIEDDRTAERFNSLIKQHKGMIDKHPEQLGNQAVVVISLKWFMELSRLAKNPKDKRSSQELFKATLDGFAEARRRKNSLFHIQCIVVFAICALVKGNEDLFLSLGFLASRLKESLNISNAQEGIRQLTAIMDAMSPGSSKKLLRNPDDQMKLITSRNSPIINWTMNLDEAYQRRMAPGKKAYEVAIEKEVLKLEAL